MTFQDRRDAGRRLADRLRHLAGEDVIVLALPRGGVPVAFEVAQALHAPLDLVLVRKIGAPGHEEYGVGAVVDGAAPQVVLNDAIIADLSIPEVYVDAEIKRQLAEIERRRGAYLGGRAPIPVAGRTVLVVDDGIATGGTVRAALAALRRQAPARLILAVPVAPAEALALAGRDADETICLATPEDFVAVGQYYSDFTQTTDAEVVSLLARSSADTASPGSFGRADQREQ